MSTRGNLTVNGTEFIIYNDADNKDEIQAALQEYVDRYKRDVSAKMLPSVVVGAMAKDAAGPGPNWFGVGYHDSDPDYVWTAEILPDGKVGLVGGPRPFQGDYTPEEIRTQAWLHRPSRRKKKSSGPHSGLRGVER